MAKRGTQGRGPAGRRTGPAQRRSGGGKRFSRGKSGWGRKLSVALLVVVALGSGWLAYRTFFAAGGSVLPEPDHGGSVSYQVYFGNSRQDPDGLDCSRVFPVPRVVRGTRAVARTALEALLEGPTADEVAEGYFSSINSGVKLLNVEVAGGVAVADFSSRLEEGVGGSCQVEAIRAQLEKTLQQFPPVREVRIRVNGLSSDVLQP